MQQHPEHHVLSDDKVNMYNSLRHAAMFKALQGRPEFQHCMAAYRTFYRKPARMWLRRGEQGPHGCEVIEHAAALEEGAAALQRMTAPPSMQMRTRRNPSCARSGAPSCPGAACTRAAC